MKALKSLPQWARKAILIGGCILGVALLITGILVFARLLSAYGAVVFTLIARNYITVADRRNIKRLY